MSVKQELYSIFVDSEEIKINPLQLGVAFIYSLNGSIQNQHRAVMD